MSFLVYDWDGRHASEDDFLGSAYMVLSEVGLDDIHLLSAFSQKEDINKQDWNLRLKSEFRFLGLQIGHSCDSSKSNEKSVSLYEGGHLEMSTDQNTKIQQISQFTFLIFKIPPSSDMWFATGH